MIKRCYYPSAFASDEGKFSFETFEREKYDYHRRVWLLKEKWRKNNCLFDKETGR